jgi:Asp-tRNA(Asn)/Glu-tRNA(Gln) amidotransferase A subunit family amidase
MLRLLTASSAYCSGIHVTPKATPSTVAGLTSTCGYPQFKDFVPAENALAVRRSEEATTNAVLIDRLCSPYFH